VRWRALTRYSLLLGTIAVLLGAGPRDYPEYREADVVARKIIDDTQRLLVQEVNDKGPVEALTQCSTVTLAMAQQHQQQGWRVRRVSLKARNRANTPDRHETKILKDFETLKSVGRLKRDVANVRIEVWNGNRDLRYMLPVLITNPVCLQCHGQPEQLLPEVKAQLQKLYPHDQATGYQLDDLRGAVSIEIPLPEE
jgi:hypothetical protein